MQVERAVNLTTPYTRARSNTIYPADQIVAVCAVGLKVIELLIEVASRDLLHGESPALYALQLEADAREGAEHPKASDRGMKEVRVLRAGQQHVRARRRHEISFNDVVTRAAKPEMVLSMDVHCQTAADGREHRPRHNCRPPTVFQAEPPHIFDGHPRLHVDDAGRRVPGEDLAHSGHVNHEVPLVHRRVSIASATATQRHGVAFVLRVQHQLLHLVRRTWARKHRYRPCSEAESVINAARKLDDRRTCIR